jgi:transposase
MDREIVMGLDLGTRKTHVCVLRDGERLEEFAIPTDLEVFRARFGARDRCRVVMEAGKVSPCVSWLLADLGYQVFVADSRRLPTNMRGPYKNDKNDARFLATVLEDSNGRLRTIQHRCRKTLENLAVIRSRDELVRLRTAMANSLQGICATHGVKIPRASTGSYRTKILPAVPGELQSALTPMIESMDQLTRSIRELEASIERISQEQYPVTTVFRQIKGVGPITALAFALIVEDPSRFARNRGVGPYLGLVPRQEQSGPYRPQLGISKAGDPLLRRLLIQCAHHILGRFGQDSDLRRFGQSLMKRGGKSAKKRAVTAVARKLAVLLLALWKTGEVYEPLRRARLFGEISEVA